ncbi:MAG: hypothetical protein ABTQ34_05365 [Bdellovibrionales bacterium]
MTKSSNKKSNRKAEALSLSEIKGRKMPSHLKILTAALILLVTGAMTCAASNTATLAAEQRESTDGSMVIASKSAAKEVQLVTTRVRIPDEITRMVSKNFSSDYEISQWVLEPVHDLLTWN